MAEQNAKGSHPSSSYGDLISVSTFQKYYIGKTGITIDEQSNAKCVVITVENGSRYRNYIEDQYILYQESSCGVNSKAMASSMFNKKEVMVFIYQKSESKYYLKGLFNVVKRGLGAEFHEIKEIQSQENNPSFNLNAAYFLMLKVHPSKIVQQILEKDKELQQKMEINGPLTIKAIPCVYKGQAFKSKLEAQHARLMDILNVKYLYEPVGFRFGEGPMYVPDFWLPELNVIIEVKCAYPYVCEIRKCEMASKKGFFVVLFYGSLGTPLEIDNSSRQYLHSPKFRGIGWNSQGTRIAGDMLWMIDNEQPLIAPYLHSSDMRWSNPLILNAMHETLNYKFDSLK